MNITLPSLADDPALYLCAFDLAAGIAQIQPMDRTRFHRSIFLDGRIERGGVQGIRAPLDGLLQGYRGPAPADRPLGFIFHVAQCGSTLLARALDFPGTSLSLREPYALRQLGVLAGEAAPDARFEALLRTTLSMLGKAWPGEGRVAIKANVPVNLIAERIMELCPSAPAIALYFGLEDYAAAVMRTEGHCQWVETVFAELNLANHPLVVGQFTRSTADRCAALWLVQMAAFAGVLGSVNARSLDAAQFLASPMPAVRAAADLFGIAPGEGAWRELAESELFTTYSKNPALDYDPEVRVAREAQTKARLASEIDEAFAWASVAAARCGLPDRLGKPLVGEAKALLARS